MFKTAKQGNKQMELQHMSRISLLSNSASIIQRSAQATLLEGVFAWQHQETIKQHAGRPRPHTVDALLCTHTGMYLYMSRKCQTVLLA